MKIKINLTAIKAGSKLKTVRTTILKGYRPKSAYTSNMIWWYNSAKVRATGRAEELEPEVLGWSRSRKKYLRLRLQPLSMKNCKDIKRKKKHILNKCYCRFKFKQIMVPQAFGFCPLLYSQFRNDNIAHHNSVRVVKIWCNGVKKTIFSLIVARQKR